MLISSGERGNSIHSLATIFLVCSNICADISILPLPTRFRDARQTSEAEKCETKFVRFADEILRQLEQRDASGYNAFQAAVRRGNAKVVLFPTVFFFFFFFFSFFRHTYYCHCRAYWFLVGTWVDSERVLGGFVEVDRLAGCVR